MRLRSAVLGLVVLMSSVSASAAVLTYRGLLSGANENPVGPVGAERVDGVEAGLLQGPGVEPDGAERLVPEILRLRARDVAGEDDENGNRQARAHALRGSKRGANYRVFKYSSSAARSSALSASP